MTDRWRIAANMATAGNAVLGVGAIVYTLAGNKQWGLLLVLLAIGLDGLDGLLSRRSRAVSPAFGRVADSVADAVTFGAAPAVFIAIHTADTATWAPYEALAIVVAGVYLAAAIGRLAIYTARAHALPRFLGAPTPQCALGLTVALLFFDTPAVVGVTPLALFSVSAALAAMMLLPVPYPKIRAGSPLRAVLAATAASAAVALVPLQFHPAAGSPGSFTVAAGSWALLASVATLFVVGPWFSRRPAPLAE